MHWKTTIATLAIYQGVKNKKDGMPMATPVIAAMNAIGDSKTPFNVMIFERQTKKIASKVSGKSIVRSQGGFNEPSKVYADQALLIDFACHNCKEFAVEFYRQGLDKLIERMLADMSEIKDSNFKNFHKPYMPSKFKLLISELSK